MNIIKQLLGGTRYELPEVRAAHDCRLPLITAYACFTCLTLQDRAAGAVCRGCGSTDLHSVSQAFVQQHNRAIQKMQEAQAKKQERAAKAMRHNPGLYLTRPEGPEAA